VPGHKTTSERITLPDGTEAGDPSAFPGALEPSTSDVRRVLPRSAVPWLLATHESLIGLPLDSRCAFVVSLVDGRCTVEMILDMACMPEDEAVEILHRLVRLGVIELHDPDE
jgi:hypothetical protein